MSKLVCRSLVPCSRLKVRMGVTLLELLLVISILAVLAGIIVVVLDHARGKARETVCRGNLKVLFHALQMYRQDWDGIDPEKGRYLQCYEVAFIPWCNLNPELKRYGVAKENLICPSDDLAGILEIWWSYEDIQDIQSGKKSFYYGSYGTGWWGYRKEVFPDHHRFFPPLPYILAKRGMDFPVWMCSRHGLERREYLVTVLVMRLSGQLTTVKATYDMRPCWRHLMPIPRQKRLA